MNEILERARSFATRVHAGQTYGDGVPYTVHLAAVEQVLRRFGATDSALLVAAWLHDSVEDTATTREAVAGAFGERVATLVWAVTNEPGANRRERHEKTLPKTRATPGAVQLKLADRIANVEASAAGRRDMLVMYRGEHRTFETALRTPGEHDAMWDHLSGLLR
jgi:(p)ppGpp synthase/HD superfamily hydrolase